MSNPTRTSRLSLEQLRKQAKQLIRAYRAGDAEALRRFAAQGALSGNEQAQLASAQFVLARESGFGSWPALKHHLQRVLPSRRAFYEQLAGDLASVCHDGDPAAVERLSAVFSKRFIAENLRAVVLERLGSIIEGPLDDGVTTAHARELVARLYHFGSWQSFEDSLALRPEQAERGISTAPPFHKVRGETLELEAPLSRADWDLVLDLMRERRITALRAAHVTDEVLARLSRLPFLKALRLQGSHRISDAGLKALARMPQLEGLDLTGGGFTDDGLTVLRELPELREFALFHHSGVSDRGLANLADCHKLERVELLGTNCGDGALRALAGKPFLRHLKSGNGVTGAGLGFLHELPVFKTWQGGREHFALMEFDAEPNLLLLRGVFTDRDLNQLTGLDGLFALNLDDSRLSLTSAALRPLAALPRLAWLAFDANDESMPAIAALPNLRMLMCQDTQATDEGFTALSRSQSIQYIWGRRCHNLTGKGFTSLAAMPSLLGLSVSCKNVEDSALAALPQFPALGEFMPMDVPDAGFRHVGRCTRLTALWCMYCRDTTDAATAHIAGLNRLKTYYAGSTQITDVSLEVLKRMDSLEQITFESCRGITNRGIAALSALPRLRELNLGGMPAVTPGAWAAFPERVTVNLSF